MNRPQIDWDPPVTRNSWLPAIALVLFDFLFTAATFAAGWFMALKTCAVVTP